jgi:hypothetical protein
MIRWLIRVLGLKRRYGVRFDGNQERTGFQTRRHADNWAKENCKSWIVWDYDPAVDMRLPGHTPPARDSYRP